MIASVCRYRLVAVLVLSLVPAFSTLSPVPLNAQPEELGMPSPASELARFAPLLGHWSGSGTVNMAPGMPPSAWTSKSTVQWVLDGHFLQEEMRIDIEGMGAPIVMRSFYGWDASQNRYVAFEVWNSGEVNTADQVSWTGDGALVSVSLSTQDGTSVLQRSITRITPEGVHYTMQVARGGGELTTLVDGMLRRSETPYSINSSEWQSLMGEVPEGMRRLHRMQGRYTMTGSMTPAPGAPALDIAAEEILEPVFGGAVMRMHVIGAPLPGAGFQYEALGYRGWNAECDCYTEIYLANTGEAVSQELRWMGDAQLITVGSFLQSGQPQARRSTVMLDETGGLKTVSADMLGTSGTVQRVFQGDYRRKPAAPAPTTDAVPPKEG